MKILLTYISILATLIIVDSVWLGVIAKNFYKSHLGHLFKADVSFVPLIIFYLVYTVAIMVFVVYPAQGILTKAMVLGAFLGVTAYMTYELVNWGLLEGWPASVVLPDILWGAFITTFAAVVGVLVL